MKLLVVGSIAFDSITTPHGEVEAIQGGSATYFSISASYFWPVRVVAVVGEDFLTEHYNIFKGRRIDTRGIYQAKGDTFFWRGRYVDDMNEAQTLETRLNVFEDFKPDIPDSYQDSDIIFLANIDPDLQLEVLRQMSKAEIVCMDTMDFWIKSKSKQVKKVISKSHILIFNHGEARLLTNKRNMLLAAKQLLGMGPDTVIIKRGEFGALMVRKNSIFWTPGYPLEEIVDPTGAGDTFAGGVVGYIAQKGNLDDKTLRKAMYFGSVMASYDVGNFGMRGILWLTEEDINNRFKEFIRLTHIEF